MSKAEDEALSLLEEASEPFTMAFDNEPFPDIIRWALDTCIERGWKRTLRVLAKAVEIRAKEQGVEMPARESGLLGYLNRRERERWAKVKVK